MFLHLQISASLEIANIALKLQNSSVNSFMNCHTDVTDEYLFTKVTLERFREHMRHFAMLPKLPGRQKLLTTIWASESRVAATVELGSMTEQSVGRPHVADRTAFQTQVRQVTVVIKKFFLGRKALETVQTLHKFGAFRMLLQFVLFSEVPKCFSQVSKFFSRFHKFFCHFSFFLEFQLFFLVFQNFL